MFKTAIFLTVIFTVIIKVNSLQCYICYDCLQVTDEYLTSCESLVSTTTSTSSTTPTSTSLTTTTPTTTSTPSSTATRTPTNTAESSSTTNTTPTTTTKSSSLTTTTPTTITESSSSSTTTTTTEAPPNHLEKNEKALGSAKVSFECFQGKIHVNNTDMVFRGCAVGRTNGTCESFGLTSCSFCNSNKCNSAGTIQSSVVLLAVMFFTYMFKD